MLRVLLTGSTGLLGGYVVHALEQKQATTAAVTLSAYGGPSRGADHGLDATDRDRVASAIGRAAPNVVIHAAALAAIGDCASDPARARRVNVEGTQNIADACREANARLVYVSTDLVFDGEGAPYREDVTPLPVSIYGRTKLDAEREALARSPNTVVVRPSLLFGPTRTARRGFFDQQLDALRSRSPIRLFDDEWRTPLSLRAAAEGLIALAMHDVVGIVHLGGPERLSRYEMGFQLASVVKNDPEGADAIEIASRLSAPGEPRARDVSLDSSKFHKLFPAIATESFTAECTRMIEEQQLAEQQS